MTHNRLRGFAAAFAIATAFYCRAQEPTFTALFIVNFAKCVEWPSAEGDFVIGVLGNDPVVPELRAIAAKKPLGERTVTVRSFESPDKVTRCHILYISPLHSNSLPRLLEKFGADTMLLVTNKKGLAEAGAPLNLTTVDGKLRYEINVESLKKTGLKAKPILFKLGTAVGSRKGDEDEP